MVGRSVLILCAVIVVFKLVIILRNVRMNLFASCAMRLAIMLRIAQRINNHVCLTHIKRNNRGNRSNHHHSTAENNENQINSPTTLIIIRQDTHMKQRRQDERYDRNGETTKCLLSHYQIY